MTTTMRKATKTVQIISRIEFKSDPRKVVYICRSSNGKDTYETTLFDGKATGCMCASRKPCYHMTGCEQKEAARTLVAEAQEIVTESQNNSTVASNECYEKLSRDEYCQVFGIYE